MVANVFGTSLQGGGEYVARLLPHQVAMFYQSQSSYQGVISMFSLPASGSAPSSELLLGSP